MQVFGELELATLEILSSDPSTSVQARMWYNSTTGTFKIDDGSAKRSLLRNDAKAVIGNSGTANDNIRFHRGATSVLQLVLGGDATGEGSLSAALAQLSSRLENYTDAGRPATANAGRLAYITDTGKVAYDNGTVWQDLASPAVVVSTKTANYTLTASDDVILADATGGGFTLTLPAAAGNSGKIFRIKKIDSSLNNVTISGASQILYIQNESLEVVSNGSTWNTLRIDRTPLQVRYNSNAAASIANNTITVMNYEDLVYDQYSLVTTGAGWVFTAPRPDKYRVNAQLVFAEAGQWTTSGETAELRIYKNGSFYSSLSVDFPDATNLNATPILHGTDTVDLAEGDTINIRVVQTSGASQTLENESEFQYVTIESLNTVI